MQPNNNLIFKLLHAGRNVTGLDYPQWAVLLVLLDHWNPKNSGAVVWPGQKRIANNAHIGQRTSQRALDGLEEKGLIKVRAESGKSNRYVLQIEVIEELTHARAAQGGTPERRDPTPERRDPYARAAYERLTERTNSNLKALPQQRSMGPVAVGLVIDNDERLTKLKRGME